MRDEEGVTKVELRNGKGELVDAASQFTPLRKKET